MYVALLAHSCLAYELAEQLVSLFKSLFEEIECGIPLGPVCSLSSIAVLAGNPQNAVSEP